MSYSVKRWIDRDQVAGAWRAGKVADITATDDYTVEYNLGAPYSELLYHHSELRRHHRQGHCGQAGADFGVKGFSTGPFCWVEWLPRNR
jgi:peptide/nickel transport system substrate-binding protein